MYLLLYLLDIVNMQKISVARAMFIIMIDAVFSLIGYCVVFGWLMRCLHSTML